MPRAQDPAQSDVTADRGRLGGSVRPAHRAHDLAVGVNSLRPSARDLMTTQLTPKSQATGAGIAGPLIVALEQAWTQIRRYHPEVPQVVLITGSGSDSRRNMLRLGHFAASRWQTGADESDGTDEIFVGGEGLARGARDVLAMQLHEAAHALARVRGSRTRAARAATTTRASKHSSRNSGCTSTSTPRSGGRPPRCPTRPRSATPTRSPSSSTQSPSTAATRALVARRRPASPVRRPACAAAGATHTRRARCAGDRPHRVRQLRGALRTREHRTTRTRVRRRMTPTVRIAMVLTDANHHQRRHALAPRSRRLATLLCIRRGEPLHD